jgi:peptidoglycan/LPS O-acetylase OafA/YrhL
MLQPATPTIVTSSENGFTAATVTYLDAVRACAANWVVLAHLLGVFKLKWLTYQGGGLGVVIFFLLSGFLISQSMVKRLRTPVPRLPGFLADRVARIMTPYVPALVFVCLVDAVLLHNRFGAPDGLAQGPLAFLGNLLMLEDYPLFQLAEVARLNLDGRIRPYNSAEPFWTVAIEFWLYVAVGLLFFCLVLGESIRHRWLWPLLLLSLPVLLWNAAAGAGKSLSLIWLAGALAGVALAPLPRVLGPRRSRAVAWSMLVFGLLAFTGHVRKSGFDPYTLQTACLIALMLFAPYLYLQSIQHISGWMARPWTALASYSYSLYLIHNTAIAVVWTAVGGHAGTGALLASVLLAHALALFLYWSCERHYRSVGRWLRPVLTRSMALARRSKTAAPGLASET